MVTTTAENDYIAELEHARLEESLRQNEEIEEPNGGILPTKSFLGTVRGGVRGAKGNFNVAAKAVASGQYVVWQTIWDFLVPTFGLSLFLVYVPIFSWLGKKFFPKTITDMLPEPGEDGMLGFVPPPGPGMEKFTTPMYGMVNKIAMGVLFFILTPILLLLALIIILPPFLIIDTARRLFGPLGELISRIFGGL